MTGQQQAMFIALARWRLAGMLREWEDKVFAEAGFMLG